MENMLFLFTYFHVDGLSSLSCIWVSRLLFRTVVMTFVDLGGGGERPDVYCSVLTSITVNWSGDLV